MRHADSGLVPDQLDRSAARRVHDRQPARHRLEHERRARVLHLRVQQEVSLLQDRRRVPLRVLAQQVDAAAQAELRDERLHRRDEAPRDEQARVRLAG
jgi:hypothetical protein